MARIMKVLNSISRKSYAEQIVSGTADYEWKFASGEKKDEIITDPKDLWNKEDLTLYNAKIKKKSDADIEFDHIVIEGFTGDNINEQVKVILESFTNPDYHWDKIQGHGKITVTHVKGERQVGYCLHDDGLHGVHLHLQVYRYVKDEKNFKASTAPMKEGRVLEAQLEYTNKKLEEAGLPVIPVATMALSNNYSKPSLDTKLEAKQITLDDKPIEEVLENIQITSMAKEKAIISSIADDQKHLGNLLQQIKNIQLEIAAKKDVIETIEENKKLLDIIKKQENNIIEKTQIIEQAQETIEELHSSYKEKLEEQKQDFNTKLYAKDEIITEKDNVISSQNKELETVIEDRDNAYAENTVKDDLLTQSSETIKKLNADVSKVNEELKQSKELSLRYKELLNSQNQQIESYKQLQEQQQLQIKEQQENLKKQQEEFEKLQEISRKQAEEIARIQEANKKQAEEIASVKKENESLKETNSKLSNIIHQFGEVTAKMKASYDSFIVSIKEKLKASPSIRKNFNEIMNGIEKKQETIYKEVSKVANQAEGQNISLNKNLIHDNKPKSLEDNKLGSELPKPK